MRHVAFLAVGLALLLVQANLFRLHDGIRPATAITALVLALVFDVVRAARQMRASPGHARAVTTFRADLTLPAAILAGYTLLVSGTHAHLGRPIPALVLPLILFMGVHEYSLARGAAVVFVLGYATDVIGILATRMPSPRARASVSVRPTRPSWGSMKIVYGTIRPAMVALPSSLVLSSRLPSSLSPFMG